MRVADELTPMCSPHCHFVRCIKPDLEKKAHVFDDEVVTRQMKCSQPVRSPHSLPHSESIPPRALQVRVYSSGYPDRMPIKGFIRKFGGAGAANPASTPSTRTTRPCRPRARAPNGSAELRPTPKYFNVTTRRALGHSKIFMRSG